MARGCSRRHLALCGCFVAATVAAASPGAAAATIIAAQLSLLRDEHRAGVALLNRTLHARVDELAARVRDVAERGSPRAAARSTIDQHGEAQRGAGRRQAEEVTLPHSAHRAVRRAPRLDAAAQLGSRVAEQQAGISALREGG
eukprot:gene46376-8165_t